MGIDHVNPKSWKGKVCVGDVNLKQQWDKGRKKVESILQKFYRHKFNFEKEFSKPQYDLIRPKGSYVGVQATPDDAWSDKKCTISLQRPETISESPTIQTRSVTDVQSLEHVESTDEKMDPDISGHIDPLDDLDNPLGMDIEDFLPDTPEH